MVKMFTVYDAKAEAYLPPFFCRSTGEAIRSFQVAANDPASNINKFAADFTLFELGEFDDDHATVKMLDGKKPLGTALEYRKEVEEVFGYDKPDVKVRLAKAAIEAQANT